MADQELSNDHVVCECMPNSNITIVITPYDSYMIISYMAPIHQLL